MERIALGTVGIIAIILIALIFSRDRKAISLRVIVPSFALQALIGLFVLRTDVGRNVVLFLANGVTTLLIHAHAGTEFIFGKLAAPDQGGLSFAIAALPTIIFFSTIVSILYYLGLMQQIVRWVGGAIQKVTGISKVESLAAASNIFVGQSESPLVVRPFIAGMSASQLFLMMTVGMAGVAGTILAAYAAVLGPEVLPYLLAASFMSAPGGIFMAKIVLPDEPGKLGIDPEISIDPANADARPTNIIMAAAEGAQTGLKIAAAVGALVLAFVAMVSLANGMLAAIGGWFGYPELSFQSAIGVAFAPIMYLLNVPWSEAVQVGGLFGTKVVSNEFVAFGQLAAIRESLSPTSAIVATFALCGFANFGSIAIQFAVLGNLAPSQKSVVASLGLRALLAGALANLMSAALAGLMLIA